MLIQKSFSKIHLRNGDEVFLVVDYELNSKLFVKLLNLKQNEVFSGHLNEIDLRSQAARIRLTFDEFIQRVITALIERPSNNSNFLYCLDEQDGTYKFQWKSIDEEQTIITLGYVDVRKESFAITLTDILEMISVEMQLMRNKIKELDVEVNKTQIQTSEALKQLKLATDMKEKLEKEMYSKFCLVLNEKKRKIRELQQKKLHNSNSSNSEFQRKRQKKSKPLDSDSSEDTEELEDINEPGPSTSKNNTSLLFHDDSKLILPTNQNRIRNRKILVSKNENENKLTTMNKKPSSKNTIVDDDESDEHLFDDL